VYAAFSQQLPVLELAAARRREHCAGVLLQALVAALQAARRRTWEHPNRSLAEQSRV
jgi:hypothetical protein